MKRWIKRVVILVCTVVIGSVLLLAGLYAFLSRANSELVSSGETRRYLLHVPDSYSSSTPTSLVISLHGAWLYPGMQKRLTGWNDLADKNGFIVVYPRATGFPRVWRLTPGAGLETEKRFFTDLIDDLSSRFNIDPARIYVTGYSNGAAMAFMLSCTAADRVAAVGMVATAIVPWDWCQGGDRPMPMLAFHGTADRFVPYGGGENFLTTEPLQSMEAWFSQWGKRNRCGKNPTVTELAADVTLREYGDCAQGVTTRFYTLEGSGHIWPGGLKLPEVGTGPYTDSINATAEMWAFFQRNPLRTESDGTQ
jgi:polyhydroxybutyrate depolymerase